MTALYEDDVFSSSSSRFQTKKAPQRKTMNGRKSSSASLRGTSLAQSLEGETGNGVSSLAYELATALAVEGGSGGSRGLAEELGFEYDEGAEGIDHSASAPSGEPDGLPTTLNSLEDAFGGVPHESHAEPVDDADDEPPADLDPAFETPTKPARQARVPEQDPMTTLEEDLESTERFLSQLRRLDVEPSGRPVLEGLASDVIRRLDDTAREREGQVRELLEYERQFRRIAGEVGGNDALGQLDAIDNLIEEPKPRQERDEAEDLRRDSLDAIQEESMQTSTSDWEAELDRDRAQLEEEPDEFDAPLDPKTLPAPPPIAGPPTPAATTVQLAHFRTVTATIATSLATISEQTQVNTAGATEAGRKIRALKNKLGEWRSDWESAERSRVKIERWEAGVVDSGDGPLVLLSPPGTPTRSTRSRVDGRKIVQAQLDAFAQTLSDATVRIQTIMAAVP
ncbi:hypothetical protein PsYK624_142820 [Phanerochaete sordida]|uniref:Uncharacterized protein n=1 Tax=Phanerochaete sordida TaxID=48140 RepID=A0A9P3GMF6_9APHY|nr:hypothetical protein PsYK624_142820 [Phanerochaete sordida]